jgi:hypothetical protein
MYGKSLNDFPDRFDSFRDALADLSDADVHAGFEGAVRSLKDFPVPAEIREQAMEARRNSQQRLSDDLQRNQRLLEDKIKDSRFEETTAEERRKEFADMIAKAAKKQEMA